MSLAPEFKPMIFDVDNAFTASALDLVRMVRGPVAFEDRYFSSGAYFYGLTQDDELLGLGSLIFRYTHSATIGILAVAPQYQWRPGGPKYGYGSTILAGLEQEAKHLRPDTERMTVMAHHSAASFYEHKGYIHTNPKKKSSSMFKNL